MFMRLDYTLYGLAIVFFIVTAVSFVVIAEQDGKSILAISTVVLGILSLSAGYCLRPKVHITAAASVPEISQEVAPEITPQVTTAVEVPVVEVPKVDAVAEVVAPAVEVPVAVEAPHVEVSPVETLVSSKAETEAPIVTPASITPVVETVVPSAESSLVEPILAALTVELTQVKGIGEKRAVQLKANGVNSVEDLAKSNAADIAEKLKVSAKIVEKWIAGAKELIK